MHCESCGTTLSDSARFCSACGKPVRRDEAPKADRLAEALQRALPPNLSIVRPLGRGGMGAVYLARDEFLDREVAIKTLPAELGSDSALRERFRREARIAAKLHHPNIVPLYTFGEAEDILYYVMGYVRGEALSQRIQREEKIDPEETRRVLAEIADALRYANGQSVVHRDLKPENILIEDSTRTAFLADFGIARMTGGSHVTRAGAVLGTPLYMSPEQAIGAEADHRSDIYALGVIGYRMLTGRFPVSGDTFSEMLAQHAARKPEPIPALNPAVPPDLSEAVMRCLEKDPAQRWQTAADLRFALVGSPADAYEDAPETQSVGIYLLLSLWVAVLFLPFEIFFWDDLDIGWRLLIEVFQVLPMFALLMSAMRIVEARRDKVAWRGVWSSVFHPPRWYWGWTPARLRPPGDVWNRLPLSLRVYRVCFSIGVLLLPMFVLAFPLAFMARDGRRVLLLITGILFAFQIPAVVAYLVSIRHLRRFGMTDERQAAPLLHTATWLLARSRNPLVVKVLASSPAAPGAASHGKELSTPSQTPTRKDSPAPPTADSNAPTIAKQ